MGAKPTFSSLKVVGSGKIGHSHEISKMFNIGGQLLQYLTQIGIFHYLKPIGILQEKQITNSANWE